MLKLTKRHHPAQSVTVAQPDPVRRDLIRRMRETQNAAVAFELMAELARYDATKGGAR